jgi:hypothetical protein
MKRLSKVLLFGAIIFLFQNCTLEENLQIYSFNTTEALKNFEKNLPLEFSYLDFSKAQSYFIDEKGKLLFTSKKENNYLTIPAIKNGKVIGRFIGFKEDGIYIDLKNYHREIVGINVSNLDSRLTAKTFFDEKNQNYFPVFDSNSESQRINGCGNQLGYNLCLATCAISAIAIAASDGPSPFMDIVAVSYTATCILNCAVSNDCEL